MVLLTLFAAKPPSMHDICQASEEPKVPEPPLILLMCGAEKQHRKSLWTKEISCKKDLELTLRNYVVGIAHDCHVNRHLISQSNDQWLQKLLAWHRLKKNGKTHYGSLASEDTLVPRLALTRFAGNKAMEVLDQFIEKMGPPSHRSEGRWTEKHGDFEQENDQIYDHSLPDLTPGKTPKGVS